MTQSVHKEFWQRMAERFGKSWYDERGLQPTGEWKSLLDQYTPQQIRAALDLIEKKRGDWRYPPTHSMVGAVLAEVAQHLGTEQHDYCREYWRSAVIASVERTGALLGMWSYGTSITAIQPPLRDKVLQASRELLNTFCENERRNGTRTAGMDAQLHEQVWNTLQDLCAEPRPKHKGASASRRQQA